MLSLIIDSANKYLIFALLDENGQQVCAYEAIRTQKNLVNQCVDKLDHFLNKKLRVAYSDLGRIYLNLGPGGFTGVKVGLNVAKTIWCLFPQIEIWVGNTMQILGVNGEIALLDARGGKRYLALSKSGQDVQLLPLNKVIDILHSHPERKVAELEQIPVTTYFWHYLLPAVKQFIRCPDPLNLEPYYIRPAV